jgi:hypothetical protein
MAFFSEKGQGQQTAMLVHDGSWMVSAGRGGENLVRLP